VDRRARRRRLRPVGPAELEAGTEPDGGRAARARRGLPDPQRVDAGRRRPAAGPGVAARRQLHRGQRVGSGLRRGTPRRTRRRGDRDLQLPVGAARVRRPRGSPRPGDERGRQLGPARPDGGAALGGRQHRRLWRRPRSCDSRRPVSRRDEHLRPAHRPTGRRPVQPGHRAERRSLGPLAGTGDADPGVGARTSRPGRACPAPGGPGGRPPARPARPGRRGRPLRDPTGRRRGVARAAPGTSMWGRRCCGRCGRRRWVPASPQWSVRSGGAP
jgi:hypothetical protein